MDTDEAANGSQSSTTSLQAARPPAGFTPRLLVILSPLFVAVALAEIGVRVFFQDEVDTERLRERNRKLEIGHLIEPAANPELLYELRKGLSAEWNGVVVRSSESEPTRISSFARPASPSAIRIALVGDSSAFGWRIEYESCYVEILRQKLEEKLGSPVELRNYALPGYNALQSRIRFETSIVPWKPDLFILHYDHNDSEPTNTAPANYIEPEYGDNVLHSALIKHVLRRLRVIRNERTVHFAEIGEGDDAESEDPWNPESRLWKAHAEELSRMGQVAAANDIPALAFVWCNVVHKTASGWNEDHIDLMHKPLFRRLEGAGFHIFDLYPALRSHAEASGWKDLRPFHFSDHDRHPIRSCHTFLAEHLFNYIVETPEIFGRLERAVEEAGRDTQPVVQNQAGDAYRRAISLAGAGKLAEAEAGFRSVIDDRPDDPVVRMWLIEVLLARNKAAEAEAQLQEAVALKPDYVQPRLRVAKYYTASGQHDKAVDQLKKAVESASSRYVKSSSMNALGEAFFAAGRIPDAERVYYEMRDFLDGDVAPLVVFAEKLMARGNLAEAAVHLEKAHAENPEYSRGRVVLANLYEKRRQATDAIRLLRSLLEEDRENADYMSRITWLMATAHDESDHDAPRAVELARKACNLTKDRNPAALAALAAALADAGDFEGAVAAVDKAIALRVREQNEPVAAELRRFRAGFEKGEKIVLRLLRRETP